MDPATAAIAILSFLLGAAWRSLYPPQLIVIEEKKIKNDEVSQRDEDADIALAQAKAVEEALKRQHRARSRYHYHYTKKVEYE